MNNPFESIEQKLIEIERLILSLKNENPTPTRSSYLTRQQAAKLLHLTLPTLHKYSCMGLIPAKRIGTRVVYNEADLQNALQNIPTRLKGRE